MQMTKQITDYVNEILTEDELRKMRDAIANGILLAYQDAIKNGNANMEVSQARGSYATLATRLTAIIYTLETKIAKGNVTMADLTQEVKEALTGGSVAVVGKNAVLKENIVDRQVTPAKLSGYDNTDAQNLIDKDNLIRGGWVSYGSGEVMEGTSTNGLNCYSVYYPVSPGDRWYKSKRSQVVIYDDQRNRISAVDPTTRIVDIPDDGRLVRLSFTYEDTELYFSKVDYYTEPTFKIKQLEIDGKNVVGKLSIDQMDFIDYNPFDGTYHTDLYVDPATANLREPSSGGARTAIIELSPQTTVYIKVNGDHNRFRVALGNSKKISSPVKIVAVDDDNNSPKSIEVNTEDYAYLFLQVSSISQTPNLIVSSSLTIGGEPVALKRDLEHIDTNAKKHSTYFERELQPVDILPSHTDVYGLWDDMKADFPNHLTKTLLGVNAQGNELYECKITMPQIRGVSKRRFKLGITCGIHGNERTPIYSIIDFVKELLENPSENELLNAFKANIDLHIIPICNPTGYDANTRSNGQGVDLNRNFTEGWVATGTPNVGYTTFSGVSPASELETQILEKWLADNEFDYVIDFHNGNPTNDFSYAVLDSRYMDAGDVYIRTLPKLSNSWAKRYPNLPQNKQYGYVSVSDVAGVRAQAISTGATALTLEAGHTMFGMDSTKDGQYAQTFSKDLIFNYLAELHKVFFG